MKERKFNWKKMLLIVSLGLNILVISALAGSVFKMRGGDRHLDGASVQGAMIRALPEDQRRQLGQRIRKNGEHFKAQRGQSRALRAALKEAIAAQPFDGEALHQVFERQKGLRSAFSERGDALWIELITSMTDEERATFSENIQFRKKRKSKP